MYILYVGNSGYPKGLAQVQRQHLIAKGLVEQKCTVLVLCRNGVHQREKTFTYDAIGQFEGVDYKYCSGTSLRPDSLIKRNLLKIKGFINEFSTILHRKYSNRADAIIITSNSFLGILYYSMLAKVLHITSVVDQVEYWSNQTNGTLRKIDFYLNNRFYFYLPDKVIVISDYLNNKIRKKHSTKPVLKIPVLCDFEKFEMLKAEIKSSDQPYFLFCGSSNYIEIITFVIDTFALLSINIDLIIIASGDSACVNEITEYVRTKKINRVIIRSNIPYQDLLNLYNNCYALLIPLRPTIQDIARFPHKIGEYTASSRPIISTNIGEVTNYFKDGSNAYLCSSYSLQEYKDKMIQAFNEKQKANYIGAQSYKTGLSEFDYKINAVKIYNFILN